MFVRLFTISLLLLVGLVGCGTHEQSSSKKSGPVDSAGQPDTEIRGATIQLYNRDALNTEVHAQHIVRFEDIDSTMGYVLDIDFYDSLGEVTSNLIADSGVIREISGAFEAYGHVVFETKDTVRLDTDYLNWNPATEHITTDAFVTITRPGQVSTGWGLDAPRDLSRVRILHQVSTEVEDMEALKIKDGADSE